MRDEPHRWRGWEGDGQFCGSCLYVWLQKALFVGLRFQSCCFVDPGLRRLFEPAHGFWTLHGYKVATRDFCCIAGARHKSIFWLKIRLPIELGCQGELCGHPPTTPGADLLPLERFCSHNPLGGNEGPLERKKMAFLGSPSLTPNYQKNLNGQEDRIWGSHLGREKLIGGDTGGW